MSPEALFRFRIVSAVDALQTLGHGKTAAVRRVASTAHAQPDGPPRQVSESTIWRWLRAYRDGGLAGLEPADRPLLIGSRVLSEAFEDYLLSESTRDHDASIPELIRRARAKGVLHPNERVDRVTVWRAANRLGIDTTPRKTSPDDTRRWSYPERMQLVMLDFKHFRAGAAELKRCAIYIIDDATRRILGARVTTSENAVTVLHILAGALRRYGRFDRVYCDKGPGFRSNDVAAALADLEIPLLIGREGYPEGRGKLERFNRSVKARLLRGLRHRDVDPDCSALTLRCRHDAFEIYNHTPHAGIDDDTPDERWNASARDLRPVAENELVEAFTVREKRRVSNDHIIQFFGDDWEVPRGHSGEESDVHRRLLEDDALYIAHLGELVRIHPVDLAHNATSRRSHAAQSEPEDLTAPVAKTSSMLAFENDLSPMTGPDGGYPDSHDDKE